MLTVMKSRGMAGSPRRATAVTFVGALIALFALLTLSACRRRGSDPAWIDTTPRGFVAAPVDPELDAGAMEDASAASDAARSL